MRARRRKSRRRDVKEREREREKRIIYSFERVSRYCVNSKK